LASADPVYPDYRRLSESVKGLHPGVDWKRLAGFRNVLVHDYLAVDLEYVYRAVERDIPRLKETCEAALKGIEAQKQVHAPHNAGCTRRPCERAIGRW